MGIVLNMDLFQRRSGGVLLPSSLVFCKSFFKYLYTYTCRGTHTVSESKAKSQIFVHKAKHQILVFEKWVLPSKMYSALSFPLQCFKNGFFQNTNWPNFLSAKSFIDPNPKILSKTFKVPSYPQKMFRRWASHSNPPSLRNKVPRCKNKFLVFCQWKISIDGLALMKN